MIPKNILEDEGIFEYLKKRNLIKQYQKSKKFILLGISSKVFFKEKQPSGSNIWYFRINNQFRAYGSFNKEGDLLIYKIDNHQN